MYSPDTQNHCEAKQLIIVHIITRWLKAGSEENTLVTCQYQSSTGHTVFVVHGNEYDNNYRDRNSEAATFIEANHLIHKINPIKDIIAIIQLRNIIQRTKADIVHTHQSKAGIIGRIAAVGTGATIVHTIHIAPFLNVGIVKKYIFSFCERWCAKFTHKLIAVSQGMKDSYISNQITEPDKIEIIHSGMDLNKFTSVTNFTASDWESVVPETSHESKPFIVLMLAAFEPRKRQQILIEEISNKIKTTTNICFVLAGEGSELQKCKNLVIERDLQNHVVFTGYYNRPEHLIKISDVCILCSNREGLPRVIVQYIAGAKPVVITHLPGINEIVMNDINGIIVPENHIDILVDKLLLLSKDDELLQSLTIGCNQVNLDNWDSNSMGLKIENVYFNAMYD